MYTLTLETNTLCNLCCKYCYLGEKTNKEMPFTIAQKAIDLIAHEALKQNDKTLFLCFLGGEPLLSYDFVKNTVEYCEKICKCNGLETLYAVTTNGTILDTKWYELLLQYKFSIRVSIDGDEYSQDLNRISQNGEGSYHKIVRNLDQFKDISVRGNEILRGVQVITKNNVSHYLNNFMHLIDLGFTYIESGANGYDDWDSESLATLRENLLNASKYYEDKLHNKKHIYWNMYFNHLQKFVFSKKCFYNCMAGLSSSFINTDGNIYFCRETDDYLKIGNVYEGLNVNKIREIAYMRYTQNSECLQCLYLNHCAAKSCFVENYLLNGNIFEPVKVNCEITKFFNEYFKATLSEKDIEHRRKVFSQSSEALC